MMVFYQMKFLGMDQTGSNWIKESYYSSIQEMRLINKGL